MDGTTSAAAADCSPAAIGTNAVSSADVLAAEYCWLRPGEKRPENLDDYYAKVREKKLAALCLSGGGIRSAAFALGVLQALSRKGILTGFHYLSTVSGGGYIGSFVQRWISVADVGAADVMDGLKDQAEVPQITYLRQHSNFITPRVGLASNDTWTAVSVSLRNVIVNWFLFLPLLLLAVLVPHLLLRLVSSVPGALPMPQFHWLDDAALAAAALLIAFSTAVSLPLLASYRDGYGSLKPADADARLGARVIFPIVLWSVAGTIALAAELLEAIDKSAAVHAQGDLLDGARLAGATFAGMTAGFLIAAVRVNRFAAFVQDFAIWPVSFAVVSAWVLLGAFLFNDLVMQDDAKQAEWAAALLTTLGPLWLMSATLVGAIVFAAFRWSEGEHVKPDSDRELIARISGMKFKPMIAWAFLGFCALLLPTLLARWTGGDVSLTSLVALVSGGAAVGGGRSSQTGTAAKAAGSRLLRFLPLPALISLATLLFLVALLILLGDLELWLAEKVEKLVWPSLAPLLGAEAFNPALASHVVLAVALALLVWLFGRQIQVNRFSLNGLYRNRLARAFLGAARADPAAPDEARRKANPFTGFDSSDNARMHRVRPADEPADKPRVLYPVINCALNVTSTENLAWQERKAMPFIFSPLFSGSGMLDPAGGAGSDRPGAYVASSIYGGREPDAGLGEGTTGVSLATAMSISGAAASPNMGYHSSPATAFLMTLFNVRLGAWLPNPARADDLGEDLSRSGPKNSVLALLSELGGSTNDRGRDVYLSDGGHFENLGVYEMLRRRCRFILVSDAGADPCCAFSDLGGLVRKAKIDFELEIKFGRMCIARRDPVPVPDPQLAWAIGTIFYPDGEPGTILYLKPSYFGDELPVDVVSYANDSVTFPHESTADQWFSESQFESYRHLGFHFADQLGPGMAPASVEAFFDAAKKDYESRLKGPAAPAAASQPSSAPSAPPASPGPASPPPASPPPAPPSA